MVNKRITDLPQASTITGGKSLAIDDLVTEKASVQQIANFTLDQLPEELPDIYNFYIKYPYADDEGTIQEQLIANDGTITKISAILGTDATGSAFIVDILNNGDLVKKDGDTYTLADITDSITNKTDADLNIDCTTKEYLAIRIIQVGSTISGQDLRIQIEVTKD
jgi:hypothetical protein